MLHIVLLVLKIIGIILAILSVLCVLILLIPFSYVGKGDFKETNKATLVSRGFLSVVYFKFSLINSDARYVLRILGIPIVRGVIGDDKSDINKEESLDNPDVSKGIKKSKKRQNKDRVEPDKYAGIVAIEETEENDASKASDTDVTFRERVDKLLAKIKRIPAHLKKIKKDYRRFKRFIKSEQAKIAFYYAKDKLKKIYNHIKPDKIEANIVFGFDSPDKTGKALAVLGVVYGTLGVNQEKFQITPDFQEKRLEGTAYMKGNFILGYVIVQLIKLYFKEEVHDIIESFNK